MPTKAPFVVVGSSEHQRRIPRRLVVLTAAVGLLSISVVAAAVRSEIAPERSANPILPSATWLVGDPPVQGMLTLETATTSDQRRRGLSFRPSLDPNTGMAFVMERANRTTMTGTDVKVPLDLVYVGPDWRVSSIERLTPGSPGIPSRSRVVLALELPAGAAAENGIRRGTLVGRMPSLDEQALRAVPDTSEPDPTPTTSIWSRY